MCLVVLAWRQHADFPLIVAGNRDEFHARPTKEAHWWPDHPDIAGGRDLQAAGTWLALHRNGRFATVTNFRDAVVPTSRNRSRGHLVTDFLLGEQDSLDYLGSIDGDAYAGFNLLVFDGTSLAWYSNRSDGPKVLEPGIYGLSNALLDSPWHKVVRSKAALQDLILQEKINETELLRLLNDHEMAPVDQVESDHLPWEKARSISAPFIVLPDYGTRSSSVAIADSTGQWRFKERRFDANGISTGESMFAFESSGKNAA
jgi:uncharacterized protein with NRDE domain